MVRALTQVQVSAPSDLKHRLEPSSHVSALTTELLAIICRGWEWFSLVFPQEKSRFHLLRHKLIWPRHLTTAEDSGLRILSPSEEEPGHLRAEDSLK